MTAGPLPRRERIRILLDHYADALCTLNKGGPGDGDKIPGMPSIYHHPSYRELERCVNRLRVEAPSQCSHLMAHYQAEWRTVDTTRQARNRKGEPLYVDGKAIMEAGPRRRERLVPPWVRGHKVELAVIKLEDWFRGDPSLPDELLMPAAA